MPQPTAIDFDRFLRFFRDLYAHAETLREMIQRQGEIDLTQETYKELRPRHDYETEQKFRIFFQALNDPEAFAMAVRDFVDTNPKTTRLQ